MVFIDVIAVFFIEFRLLRVVIILIPFFTFYNSDTGVSN